MKKLSEKIDACKCCNSNLKQGAQWCPLCGMVLGLETYPRKLREMYQEIECEPCTSCFDTRNSPKLAEKLWPLDGQGKNTPTGKNKARISKKCPIRFQFDWWPGISGNPENICYLFLAMEPSVLEPGDSPVQQGCYDPSLRIAISKNLLLKEEGCLITNLGKCSLPGNVAEDTFRERYRVCSRKWLLRELESFRFKAVFSIGKKPIEFLQGKSEREAFEGELRSLLEKKEVNYLMHYSPRNRKRFRELKDSCRVGYLNYGQIAQDQAIQSFINWASKGNKRTQKQIENARLFLESKLFYYCARFEAWKRQALSR